MDEIEMPTAHDTESRRSFLASGARIVAASGVTTLSLRAASGQAALGLAEFTLRAGKFMASPDGRVREVWGYNGQLPGPLLRVKEGTRTRIRVENGLPVPTSIHWHGFHQRGTPTMDGVEGVAREPIAPGSAFVYDFVAEPAGTHWYHSHVGVQYGNGLFGPFIVDEASPIAAYDRDEVLLINDWFREEGDVLLAGLLSPKPQDTSTTAVKRSMRKMADMPPTKKMAGRDRMPAMVMPMMDVGDLPFESGLINGKGRATGTNQPLTPVEVGNGETVRLRLINGSSTFSFRFQIDGHPLTVIACDGAPVKPVEVDNLVFAAGERYDVLLKAQTPGAYWIRAATLDGDEVRAVLRYRGESRAEPASIPVRWGMRALMPEMLRSPAPAALAKNPREIPLNLGGTMMPYRWSIGGQYYPNSDPIAIGRGESVRLVFRNPTGMDHPFHLHGHSFYVLGKPGALNLVDPVLKDTVTVPARSDLVIQWVADNPGRWFFHCHIEWHMATGMARVIEIS
jgi:FtsP/CotA-like multicopper oxidase with cupredoxin domain